METDEGNPRWMPVRGHHRARQDGNADQQHPGVLENGLCSQAWLTEVLVGEIDGDRLRAPTVGRRRCHRLRMSWVWIVLGCSCWRWSHRCSSVSSTGGLCPEAGDKGRRRLSVNMVISTHR